MELDEDRPSLGDLLAAVSTEEKANIAVTMIGRLVNELARTDLLTETNVSNIFDWMLEETSDLSRHRDVHMLIDRLSERAHQHVRPAEEPGSSE